jgi:hypothetical protein
VDTATQRTPGETTVTPEPVTPEAPPEPPPTTFFGKVKALRKRYAKQEHVLFFIGGFCFDLLLLERIDSVPMLIHQGSYVALLTVLMAVDHHYTVKGPPKNRFGAKALEWRLDIIHFLFGTLLNAFLVFYFKAASGVVAFLFMAGLGALLLANELPRFRKLGPLMRMALYSFTVTSYLSYLGPVLFGFLSAFLFVTSAVISSAVIYGLWRLYSRWTHDPQWTFKRAVAPALAIQAALVISYFLHAVPPVPLSLKWIGMYHDVVAEKDERGRTHEVRLMHQRPFWRIWEHGDQTFRARPGDRIHAWMRIFAPKKFHDKLYVRWSYYDEKQGWIATERGERRAIPLTIQNAWGSEEGWYGDTYKENYRDAEGRVLGKEWKVTVLTDDDRTVGGISFTLLDDESTEPRQFQEDIK